MAPEAVSSSSSRRASSTRQRLAKSARNGRLLRDGIDSISRKGSDFWMTVEEKSDIAKVCPCTYVVRVNFI